MENWKNVLGFEGLYEVSDLGNVRSVDREVTTSLGTVKRYKGKLLKGCKDKDGYARVRLSKDGVHYDRKIHRLVLQAFIGDTELLVDHINHIRDDNRLENLRYVDKSENMKNQLPHKRYGKIFATNEIETIEFTTIKEAVAAGFNKSAIYGVINGNFKQHLGYTWTSEYIK